ncbi:MAG: glycosyltransferase family 4 protein, partial [Devosia sp.]
RGRKIFAYIGNMGVAQGMDVLIDMAENLAHRPDAGLVFVGRGSDFARLQAEAKRRNLTNTLFFDEIPATQIPGLLDQCFAGLVALDPAHKSHNIPGKFLSYLRAGLPVLARVNAGTDLIQIIDEDGVGRAFTGNAASEMARFAEALMDDPARHADMRVHARNLAERDFSPAATVVQIMSHLR